MTGDARTEISVAKAMSANDERTSISRRSGEINECGVGDRERNARAAASGGIQGDFESPNAK